MKKVESKGIRAYGYKPDERELVIEWASGRTYAYSGVEPELVIEMESAPSLGAWCARHLSRGSFEAREVTEE